MLILWMFEMGWGWFITVTLLSADVDARHGVEFGRWLSLSLFHCQDTTKPPPCLQPQMRVTPHRAFLMSLKMQRARKVTSMI